MKSAAVGEKNESGGSRFIIIVHTRTKDISYRWREWSKDEVEFCTREREESDVRFSSQKEGRAKARKEGWT